MPETQIDPTSTKAIIAYTILAIIAATVVASLFVPALQGYAKTVTELLLATLKGLLT